MSLFLPGNDIAIEPAYTPLRRRQLLTGIVMVMLVMSLGFLMESHKEAVLAPPADGWSVSMAIEADTHLGTQEMLHSRQDDFAIVQGRSINLGYSDKVLWLSVRRVGSTARLEYLEIAGPLLDKLDFYQVTAAGAQLLQSVGDTRPFGQREINFRNFVFPLHAGESGQYLIRVQTQGSFHFGLQFYHPDAFRLHLQHDQLINGLYFGVLLAMLLYNLLYFIKLGDHAQLAYVIYVGIFALLIMGINGMGQEYLWGGNPAFGAYRTLIWATLINVAAILFARAFLQSRVLIPRLDRYLIGMAILNLVLIPSYLVLDFTLACRIVNILGIITAPLVLVAGVLCWLRGYRPARFLVLGWAFLMLAVFFTGLMFLGLLPTTSLTTYGLQIGSGIEVVLLSWALSDKMALIKRGKERAQRRTLELMQARNQELDEAVRRRTRELEDARTCLVEQNRNLALANRRLKQTATHDGLTGLLNHQAFIDDFATLQADTVRYQYPVSLIMMDLDHFKQINDRYGHEVGNEVLKAVAQVLRDNVRGSDLAGRYGGEEFVLALSHTDIREALAKAEGLLGQIQRITLPGNEGLSISASMGVAPCDGVDPGSALKDADAAMYRAKESGRARICLVPV